MKKSLLFLIALFVFFSASSQKFDQLAKTPPMGWNSWNKYHCDVSEELILKMADAKDGDLLLISSAEKYCAYTILGALRLELARQLGIMEKLHNTFSFHWVIDFPLFEYAEDDNRWVARHHPFTSPKPDHISVMINNDPVIKRFNVHFFQPP